MSVSEHERHQLFTWFEEHMGSERAATMMSLFPPVGWGDVATRRDLELLRRDLDQHIAATRNDIDLLRHDVRHLDARLDADIASLRHDLREQMRTIGTWLFASQAAVIAAVSLLFALL